MCNSESSAVALPSGVVLTVLAGQNRTAVRKKMVLLFLCQ